MMTAKIVALIVLLAGFGVMTNFRTQVTGYTRPTEAWLEDVTPAELTGFNMVRSLDNPKQSYKMDPVTYEVLDPFGIVARIFVRGTERFEAVVIAGDNADSFHDQRGCFQGQGWTITRDRHVTIQTKSRGEVPMNLLTVSGPQGDRIAAYCFQGPSRKLYSKFFDMWKDFMSAELKTGQIQKGVFFRFIALNQETSEEDLLQFAADYLDATEQTSAGSL